MSLRIFLIGFVLGKGEMSRGIYERSGNLLIFFVLIRIEMGMVFKNTRKSYNPMLIER